MTVLPPTSAAVGTLGAADEAVTVRYGVNPTDTPRPNGGLAVQLTGTFDATVTLEHTVDGDNWVALLGINTTTGGDTSTATAPAILRAEVVGSLAVRARCSTYVSGSVVVTLRTVDG
jgi:hypothetical protein